jgi:hypothetical protein
MAVQPYTAGPAEIFIHDGSNFLFLGYSESGARINWIRHFTDYMTDKSGPKMPADKQFMGLGALVSCDLTQFSHAALNIARRCIRTSSFGALAYGDLGQMMVAQGNTYRFCIRQPYAVLFPATYPGMPAHIHFKHAVMIDENEPVGTKAKIIPIVWEMMCPINPCTGIGDFFDTNPGTLPYSC